MGRKSGNPSRRTVLKATGAVGAASLAGLAGCIGGEDDSIGNYPPEGDEVMYGCNAPQSGGLSGEGTEMVNGFYLAIDHLNNGGGAVDHWDELDGEGVLDYAVDGTDSDSDMDEDVSDDNVQRMIEDDGIQMWTGGMMSPVTIAGQALAQQERVPFMGGNSTTSSIGGSDCSRYYFHSSIHADLIGMAAGATLPEVMGDGLDLAHIYMDYSYGHANRDAINSRLVDETDWENVGEFGIDSGEPDHTSQINDVQDSGADVVHFASFGDNAASGLDQMAEVGLLDELEGVVIPHITNMTVDPIDSELRQNVYGFEPWNPAVGEDDDAAQDFVDAYEAEYGEIPSQSAWMTYDGVLHYSAAVERVGSFFPPDVIRDLETETWTTGWGGDFSYQECDHVKESPVYLTQGSEEGADFPTTVVEASEPLAIPCDEYPAEDCDMDSHDYGDE